MKDQIDLSKMQSVPEIGIYGFQRLRRYWKEPTSEMWDEIWSKTDEEGYWQSSLKGELLEEHRKTFLKYLPSTAKVLEAGCGVGQVVLALRARGYDCVGLDYAEKIISNLNNKFPEVPFVRGDIRSLPYDAESFDGYISLGVIEHFTEGQDKMLQEAARVIKTGGYIFLSVPCLNEYRKLRIKLKTYKKTNFEPTAPYFESCFSEEELTYLLKIAGFEKVDKIYINPVMTFAQESPIRGIYKLIEDKRYIRSAIDRILKFFLPESWFGHMIMIVAKKST